MTAVLLAQNRVPFLPRRRRNLEQAFLALFLGVLFFRFVSKPIADSLFDVLGPAMAFYGLIRPPAKTRAGRCASVTPFCPLRGRAGPFLYSSAVFCPHPGASL